MRFFLFILFFPVTLAINAQVLIDSDNYKKKLSGITTTTQLPEGLLTGKSVVIHMNNIDYRKNAAALQPGFQKAGIDVIAHYNFEDIFSATEVIQAYKNQLKEREVDFLIYYNTQPVNKLLIMSFGEDFFNDQAFSITHTDQKELMHSLYLTTARSEQEKLNLLILGVPQFTEYPDMIEGRRAEFYDLNMKSGKVAIPSTGDSLFDASIDSVMAAHYPYRYGFVEPGFTEADLRKEDYWFILYGIHSSGKSVRKLLDYETTGDEVMYESVVADGRETSVTKIPAGQHVYKFYIKQIQRKDLFLGKHYDAAETWEQALINYIFNLRNILD